jgi:carbonic anhydrase
MDYRKSLRIPDNFAYVMRAGGAKLQGLEFQISFAIAVGGVKAIAIIGHNRCGMSGLSDHRDEMVEGLVLAGWDRLEAERHFEECAPRFEVGDPVVFTRAQVRHLRNQYPRIVVAPLVYNLDDHMLYLIGHDDKLRS